MSKSVGEKHHEKLSLLRFMNEEDSFSLLRTYVQLLRCMTHPEKWLSSSFKASSGDEFRIIIREKITMSHDEVSG